MDINKYTLISDSIENGDWTTSGDLVTRDDLMDYIIEESQTQKQIPCPICTKNIKPYKVTFTHRSAKYGFSAVHLSNKAIADGGDGYVHHDLMRLHCQGNFKYLRGKKIGKGINYTSYANLTRYPWNFLEPMVNTKDKTQRNGEFKPTERFKAFLRGKISIPEWILVMNGEVVRYSEKNINVLAMKDVNFQQCIELFKTFS